MPKVTDYKAYFKEIATKAGLKDDVIQQVIGDDNAFKAFTDGFKPLPDYSHDLDDVRNRTKTETQQAKDAEYADWYKKEQTKYGEFVSVVDQYKKYKEVYGDLDPNFQPSLDPANPNPVRGKVMTQEEIKQLMATELNETLTRRDNAYLTFLDLREQHLATFGKPLDRKAFETAYKDHPEWGDLQSAYNSWTGPEMDKIREAKSKAEADRRYEEGVRDGFSRRAVPADSQPKTFSPLFDQKAEVTKLSEREQESHSRSAFFEGLRESNKQPA